MSTASTPDLSQFVNVIPGYPEVPMSKNIWLIILAQWFLCLLWSICSSYYAYKTLYGDPEKSWKRIIQLMGPIFNRIQNLENEKTIWYSYLEWIEEYCNVYYGLLNYTNTKVGDLEKIIKYPYLNLKNIGDNWSKENIQETKQKKKPEEPDKGMVMNDVHWKDLIPFDDAQLFSDFARVLATLKTIHSCGDSENNEAVDDEMRSYTDLPSSIETTEDYFRDELESFRESSDDEKFELPSKKKTFYHLLG